MTVALVALVLTNVALLLLIAWLSRQWAVERAQLLNRIQAPEVAPFIDVPTDRQYVRFEDDNDFRDAMEEMEK